MTVSAVDPALDGQQLVDDDHYDEEEIRDSEADDASYPIAQYDIVSSPNDFNTRTMVDFIDSGVVIIPGFQRNYVWDIKRASRLIESLIAGLPVPQVFLYEKARDEFLVIDGQQRLMSIYYFVKGRFPKKEKLAEIRIKTDGLSNISPELLASDECFSDFVLNLPEAIPGQTNRLHKRQYSDLEDSDRTSFDLRTIRHIIVRQMQPDGDDAMYEIFNRLNSGGVNLTPQEVRRCAYDSKFYDMLYETNARKEWRALVGGQAPDINLRDVEILLRGFAMLISGASYRSSMVKFLNQFSKEAKSYGPPQLEQLRELLDSFLDSCSKLPQDAFHTSRGRFSPTIFESVFVAACEPPYADGQSVKGKITNDSLSALKDDEDFRKATQSRTTDSANVAARLARARLILEMDQAE